MSIKPIYKRWWFIIVAIFLCFVILGFLIDLLTPESVKEKLRREDFVRDSIAKQKKIDDSLKLVKEEEEFKKLPKKEQEKILQARDHEKMVKKIKEHGFFLKNDAERFLKQSLKNPDSYDKKEIQDPQIITYKGVEAIQVKITFNATNSFGGIIRETKSVLLNANGVPAFIIE